MSIKLKAKATDGVVEVKALIEHPMETGQRKDKKTGEKIPAHFINKVEVMSGDKLLLSTDWGTSISTNPYLAFSYKGAAGEKVKLTWTDNKGETGTAEADVA